MSFVDRVRFGVLYLHSISVFRHIMLVLFIDFWPFMMIASALLHLPWSLWRPRKNRLWVGIHLYRHTFCYICIENWANLKKNCPLCKQSIKKRKLEKDLIAFNIIDDLQSKCMHENCPWEGAYSQLKKHQRWCEFKPKKQIESIIDAVEV